MDRRLARRLFHAALFALIRSAAAAAGSGIVGLGVLWITHR
jgi:hypothetical protein